MDFLDNLIDFQGSNSNVHELSPPQVIIGSNNSTNVEGEEHVIEEHGLLMCTSQI